jgi:hypothetical protein
MGTPYLKDCSQDLAHVLRTYSLFKTECSSTNTKFYTRYNITNTKITIYKAPIGSVMTHASPT